MYLHHCINPQRNLCIGLSLLGLAWLMVACNAAPPTPFALTPTPAPVIPIPATPTPQPTPTNTPVPIPSPLPTPTATPRPEVRLEVSSYNTYRKGSIFYVAGVAINRGNVPAGEVRIAVSLLDPKGNVAATSSSNTSAIQYVPPNGKYPFLVNVSNAPQTVAEVKIQFETKPFRKDQLYKPIWELKVDKVTGLAPASPYNTFGYAGRVTNLNAKAARMVRVVAIAYDANDKVLDVDAGYVPFEYLNPKADAPFNFRFQNIKTAPARAEFLAEGHEGSRS